MKRVSMPNGKNGKNGKPKKNGLPLDSPWYIHGNSTFKADYVRMARAMCLLGATDAELAMEFDCTLTTVYNWRCKYRQFGDACTVGKDAFDERVERSLAMLATGFHYMAEEFKVVDKQVERIKVVKYHPPEFLACMAW